MMRGVSYWWLYVRNDIWHDSVSNQFETGSPPVAIEITASCFPEPIGFIRIGHVPRIEAVSRPPYGAKRRVSL